ncbi:uncharacterized protein I303_104502 [Kwoniella dejecticola CBS 10117]|uniref:Ricin B lectin domain-containing protein n=1 Tax=Kwoniella dejecticola CBS 10117 TaxID=1296121 RepID=A0A1A6A572_9TREE|nr:uncharacterized protein I303_04520 [Kwoniella dejecticola CBS 10117]OBR85188.1 hypothetical protein I303_04520 [Kwoniella dejecticola CBS 10117]
MLQHRILMPLLPLLAVVSATSLPNRMALRQTAASSIQPLGSNDQAGDTELCVTVMGGQAVVGASLHLATCFDHPEQEGEEDKTFLQSFACSELEGEGEQSLAITLQAAPNLCIDRGSDDAQDGSGLQLQECADPPIPAQLWRHDDQSRILSQSGDVNKCLVIQEGSTHSQNEGDPYASEKYLQTWTCADYNQNQVGRINGHFASGTGGC